MSATILIVEDESAIREMTGFALAKAGFRVVEAADTAQAERAMTETPPDLILLDWMLPGTSGLEFTRRLKRDRRTRTLPIIMLTARGEEEDKIRSLETVLRGLVLDVASHRVSADGTEVALGPTEFRLLHFFMRHPERVFSRAQILDHVWGTDSYVEERTVDVHIRRLRKALAPHGHDGRIQTVRGAGYRFSHQA